MLFKKISNKIFNVFKILNDQFSLSDKGERADIDYNKKNSFNDFDVYQKNHYKRYEFAKNLLSTNDIVGDFACGTGYGTSMLGEKAAKVIGIDIKKRVINKITKRYKKNKNIEFITSNILNIEYKNYFDKIISFETIEHLEERSIPHVFKIFFKALKPNGEIIFSTPYMQEKNEKAIQMGFHKTFFINENKIQNWLNQSNLKLLSFKYQNYESHTVFENINKKDFIICIAKKYEPKSINLYSGL